MAGGMNLGPRSAGRWRSRSREIDGGPRKGAHLIFQRPDHSTRTSDTLPSCTDVQHAGSSKSGPSSTATGLKLLVTATDASRVTKRHGLVEPGDCRSNDERTSVKPRGAPASQRIPLGSIGPRNSTLSAFSLSDPTTSRRRLPGREQLPPRRSWLSFPVGHAASSSHATPSTSIQVEFEDSPQTVASASGLRRTQREEPSGPIGRRRPRRATCSPPVSCAAWSANGYAPNALRIGWRINRGSPLCFPRILDPSVPPRRSGNAVIHSRSESVGYWSARFGLGKYSNRPSAQSVIGPAILTATTLTTVSLLRLSGSVGSVTKSYTAPTASTEAASRAYRAA